MRVDAEGREPHLECPVLGESEGFAFLHPTAPVTADALYYDAMARAILERGALVSPTGELTASRMPGADRFR